MDKNILKQLKTDYEDLEIKPSVNLWNQIESRIEGTEKEAEKPLFHWWKYAAVLVLLISVGGLFYFNSNENLRPKELIATHSTSNNASKSVNISNEAIVLSENITQKTSTEFRENKNESHTPENRIAEKKESAQYSIITEKGSEIVEIPKVSIEKIESTITKPRMVESKKTSYISADDLLLGREFDRTRGEASSNKQFGVLDASNLKIKQLHSLRIFGMKVFSDSSSAE
ncbi:hypothetical protein [Chryseobacterium turcicum]|uniref:Uncharacterized protein n=1 Tax=Chryseobacterium turcicum TaxID=2898076 RepID=A0A9Q3YVM0_9FLAO|nr:hypothetical protein [Chryseobacterium turcicum]MCD1117043.1 hypothetical protein [Chryseobacterium turcicum]